MSHETTKDQFLLQAIDLKKHYPVKKLSLIHICSNYSRWCDKSFEDQIQPARATADQAKRIEYYKQAQVVMHDQVPALMIAHSTVYEPVSKKVSGYKVDPLGGHYFAQVDIKE